MQEVWAGVGEGAHRVVLPRSDEEVIAGVAWGSPDLVNTPAYWAVRCKWDREALPNFVSTDTPLIEEVGFCLLGGFGIKFEVNVAAFERMKAHHVFESHHCVSEEEIRHLLARPLSVAGRQVRYRFPNQRAKRLAEMRQKLSCWKPRYADPLELREQLMDLDGIGPKTASWIVRNHLGSDEVAIIDVHVIRACRQMSVFPANFALPRDYEALERRFLDFAKAINVRPSVLDAVMWTEVRGGLAA